MKWFNWSKTEIPPDRLTATTEEPTLCLNNPPLTPETKNALSRNDFIVPPIPEK